MMLLWGLIASLATAPAPATVPAGATRFARMAALYDDLCLHAFPDDAALAAKLGDRGATPMTPAEVRVTLQSDPGRGWTLLDEGRLILVILELPPYHACSVRFSLPERPAGDQPYRAVIDRFERDNPGFDAAEVLDQERDGLRIHATQEARARAGGGGEALMLIDQEVIDPARRARGETGIMRRFVHQIASAPSH